MGRARIGRGLSVGVMSVVLAGTVALLIHRTLDRSRCDSGLECLHMADEAWYGDKAVVDLDRAAALFLRACEEGLSEGCTQFWILTSSQAFEKLCNTEHPDACALPLAEADRIARRCDEGSSDDCFKLALMDVHANLDARDRERGEARLEALCDADHAEACLRVARAGWNRPDHAALYEKSCALGAALACDELATDLFYAAPKHQPRVIDLYDRACALGAPEGCLHLADILLVVDKRPENVSRGLHAMSQACALSPRLCFDLNIACHHHPGHPACPPVPPLRCSSPLDCVEQGEAAEGGLRGRSNPDHAARLFGAACDGGLAEGCERQWSILINTLDDPQAAQVALGRAYEALDRRCNAGEAPACLHLGELRQRARHTSWVPRGPIRMFEVPPPPELHGCDPDPLDPVVTASLSRACALDLARGCQTLGEHLARGNRVAEADAALQKAKALFEQRCAVGDVEACEAQVHALELAEEDASRAYERLEAALIPTCDDAQRQEACQRLAGLYLTRRRPAPSLARVEALMQQRCEEGLWGDGVTACVDLAGLLLEGRLVAQDVPRAGRLYRQACNEGHVGACHALNRICERDPEFEGCFEVNTLSLASAEEYYSEGLNHFEGTTVHRNVGQAVWLMKEGCQAGSWSACDFLSRGLEAGEFLNKDPAQASAFHERACALGQSWDCQGKP